MDVMLEHLNNKCNQSLLILGKLGSKENENSSFEKGQLLLKAESDFCDLQEKLRRQVQDIQLSQELVSSKNERLHEARSNLDHWTSRVQVLQQELEATKLAQESRAQDHVALEFSKQSLNRKLQSMDEKIRAMETFHLKNASSSVQEQDGSMSSLLRQSELFKRLGLSVSKVSGQKIRISFHLVDPKDHQRQFYFQVAISDEVYLVEEVNPPLKGISKMVEDLNATNDFSRFTRQMRKRFQESCSG